MEKPKIHQYDFIGHLLSMSVPTSTCGHEEAVGSSLVLGQKRRRSQIYRIGARLKRPCRGGAGLKPDCLFLNKILCALSIEKRGIKMDKRQDAIDVSTAKRSKACVYAAFSKARERATFVLLCYKNRFPPVTRPKMLKLGMIPRKTNAQKPSDSLLF